MILNLASVCGAENSKILWGFIENYYPKIEIKKEIFLNELLEYGVNYYQKFIKPKKKFRPPTERERVGFLKLVEVLKKLKGNEKSEEIQKKIYEIGKSLDFESLRDWFLAFYEVILGQKEGPRLGSFINLYGISKTIKLIEKKIEA